MEMNGYAMAVLVAVCGIYVVDVLANALNLRALRERLPGEFEDTLDADEYARSQDYSRTTTKFDLIQSTAMLVIFLLFWFLGGFAWMDQWISGFGYSTIVSGLLCLGVFFVANLIFSLPFDLYSTFVIEEKFGFNKTTPATFVADQVKGLILTVVIGVPVLTLVLWFLQSTGSLGWLYAWAAMVVIMLALTYLAPRYIMPLFNKFEPLESDELKSAIHAMAEKCSFPLAEVFVVDGSRRSSKANAFFVGIGKNKKIALYDTLVKEQETDELVGVLAHEIGHFKLRHIVQNLIFSILQLGLLLFLLGQFALNAGLSNAFGVTEPKIYFGLLFFTILYKPISFLISVAGSILSRKHEFEADAYAAKVTGRAESLVSALKKLSKSNLANLTPHPFFVFLYHSHPPLVERIQALRKQLHDLG